MEETRLANDFNPLVNATELPSLEDLTVSPNCWKYLREVKRSEERGQGRER
jgi:hypothetical protein